MFDVKNCVKTRYFDLKMYDKDGKSIVLNVEPPKVKTLKALMDFSKKEEVSKDEFRFMITAILSKNKDHVKVDKYVDELDTDQLNAVYTAFMEWLNNQKKSKN